MNENETYLTKEGFEKLTRELDELVHVRRKEIAARIQEAKELGDLSENAEYQEAKTEQGFNEGRIEEIESILRRAVMIEEGQKPHGVVEVGMNTEVRTAGKTLKLQIVGSNEADPMNGLISNASPLGRSLLGKRVGEKVMVETPRGEAEYEILGLT